MILFRCAQKGGIDMENVHMENEEKWNPEEFKQACENIRRICLKKKKVDLPQYEDYDFSNIKEVYAYIAQVILEGKYTDEGVREWSKPRSKGPDRRKTDSYYKKVKKFLYGMEDFPMLEDYNMVKKQYSDFTKQRVFEVHKSIMDYLLYLGDEDVFWKMNNILDENRVALPKEIANVFQSFINQYLEVHLFGERITKKCESEVDISDMKKESLEKEWEDPELRAEFQLRNLYEAVCDKYIKPILREE